MACRQRLVAIRNEDRGLDLSALFHHDESLNDDTVNVANVGGATKPALMKFLSGTCAEQAEYYDAMCDHAAHSSPPLVRTHFNPVERQVL